MSRKWTAEGLLRPMRLLYNTAIDKIHTMKNRRGISEWKIKSYAQTANCR
jgi:hypothetical protein